MGKALAERYPEARKLFDEADAILGRSISGLCFEGPEDELQRTENTQPALYLTSAAALAALRAEGYEGGAAAGHSLGEYSALYAAGALDFATGLKLVQARGRAMEAAGRQRAGTMAAVLGLDDDQVQIACHRVGGEVWLANYNAPGQVVIAGLPDDVAKAAVIARELGAKRTLPLAVGGAFHTPLMAAARDRLQKAIDRTEFRDPIGTVIANVDAADHPRSDDWPDLLKAQLCSPVRWRQTLRCLDDCGFTTFVELGPGSALTGMAKRTVKEAKLISVSTPNDLDGLLEALAPQPTVDATMLEGERLMTSQPIAWLRIS
jgi:[acyl-carrier-protein] S-malonyltransferase